MTDNTDDIYKKNIFDLEQQLHDARMKIIALNKIKNAAEIVCKQDNNIFKFSQCKLNLANAIRDLETAINDEE